MKSRLLSAFLLVSLFTGPGHAAPSVAALEAGECGDCLAVAGTLAKLFGDFR